jgi:hypothetical protein
MMTEPRPPWGVRLFREVALEALRGRREALIRRAYSPLRSLIRRVCRLPGSLWANKLAVWESCFVPGEPPLATLLRIYAQKEIAASSDMKSITKGLKTLPIAQVDKLRSMGGPQPVLQKSSKSARVYRFLLRAENSNLKYRPTVSPFELGAAVRAKLNLKSSLRNGYLPVFPVFKEKSWASLVDHNDETQTFFPTGLGNQLFEVRTTRSVVHFADPRFSITRSLTEAPVFRTVGQSDLNFTGQSDMDRKCESKLDRYRCQLPRNHPGEHANYGKPNDRCFVRWSDDSLLEAPGRNGLCTSCLQRPG